MTGDSPSPARRLAELLRPAIGDERVLDALASLARERFVEPADRRHAYDNVPLPIGWEQTISQPLVVARMCDLLELADGDRVLDIGTGSGYHAAMLARLSRHVWSVERHGGLSTRAGENLRSAGVDNVTLVVGDGSRGLPEHAPYDAINVAAAVSHRIPAPLEDQLAPGGRLIAPVRTGATTRGSSRGADQHLMLVHRGAHGLERRVLEPVRFVPLVDDDST
jgi:protein-L-isoaspartate(D-aspartate) O-methyltransferase